MKLSVIIPYYNSEKYIYPLLESLLDQGFQKDEYEIIVVDDGSPNDVSRLREFCDKSDTIKYVRQENGRQSKARNNGISKATGEYLYFCDSDDCIRKDVLSRICDIASQNELDILYFNRVIVKEKELPPPAHNNFELTNIVTGQEYFGSKPDMSTGVGHYFIRNDFVSNNKILFPENILSVEDTSFTIDSLISAKRVAYVDVDVYYWIQHPESISHYEGKKKMAEQYNHNKLWFVEKYSKILKEDLVFNEACRYSIWHHIEIISFSMLHNSLRYLPISKSKELTHSLRTLGCYPFGKHLTYGWKFMTIVRIMNCYPLWMFCCGLFSVLPKSIKQKL